MAVAARSLVVLLPAFRLERCGFDADDLAGVIDEVKNAMRLVAITPAARREGLRVGMTASEARALVPTVELLEHHPAEEDEDRASLVRAFDALSDQVRFPWPDALALSVGSVAHLFEGEKGAAQRAVALAGELGHRARAVVADDPLAALAVAEATLADGEICVVAAGGTAPFLAGLPLATLRPPLDLDHDLRAIGIRTVGQFAQLDPASVAGRYPRAVELHRIARGLPGSLAHLHVRPEAGAPRVSTALGGATTLSELQFVLPGLVAQLCGQLADRNLAAVRLRVVLHLESMGHDGPGVHAEIVRVGRPTRAPQTLERLIRGRLSRLVVGSPMEQVVLEAVESTIDLGWQPGLSDRKEAKEPLPDLLARLGDQLGDGALFSAVPADSWAPERSWDPAEFPAPALWLTPSNPLASGDPLEVQEAFEHHETVPRPSLLLPVPEPIEVEVESARGRPIRARLGPRENRVHRCVGPERLTGAWWDLEQAFDRAYWVVEVDGRAAWIFEEAGRWRLHGWFD